MNATSQKLSAWFLLGLLINCKQIIVWTPKQYLNNILISVSSAGEMASARPLATSMLWLSCIEHHNAHANLISGLKYFFSLNRYARVRCRRFLMIIGFLLVPVNFHFSYV